MVPSDPIGSSGAHCLIAPRCAGRSRRVVHLFVPAPARALELPALLLLTSHQLMWPPCTDQCRCWLVGGTVSLNPLSSSNEAGASSPWRYRDRSSALEVSARSWRAPRPRRAALPST